MIGILAAMDTEVEAIKNVMEIKKEELYQGMNFTYGTIENKEVVLCKCGVGKCLASMSATLLCTKEKLSALINVGVAGGLKEDQNVLDIVISDKIVQADYDTSPIDGDDGIGLVFEADEIVISKGYAVNQNIKIGDKIKIKGKEYTVTGNFLQQVYNYFPLSYALLFFLQQIHKGVGLLLWSEKTELPFFSSFF